MATTHYLIGKVTVGSGGAANIEFTSIPQTYTDLALYFSTRDGDTGGSVLDVQFNSSTSNLSMRYLRGSGSAATSGTEATRIFLRSESSDRTTSTFANGFIYITNYTSSNYKSISGDSVEENNATGAYSGIVAGLWSNTAAITSIKLVPGVANLAQYSTAYLYGISTTGDSTKVPYASGGDVIATDGTYWIHTFKSSGTFTPLKALTADYLVVAGGGGGGYSDGGGGGAGGLRSTVTATGGGGTLESALSLTANTGYTVTIGGGGAGRSSNGAGTSGSNSVFSTITSTGGGGGGGGSTTNGLTGGSGGGGGNGGNGGAGTANQGYAGGNSSGGGGGAGATGSNSGSGGNGVATSISGTSTTYAGGGVGSSGSPGSGGGGATSTDGTANTGGGGGRWGGTGNSGAGGSGIVIVRYPV